MRRLNSTATALAMLAVITFLTAACGGSSHATPTSPSSPLATDGGAAATGATISGTVQGAGPSSLTSATTSHALTGLSVAVVGTPLSTVVDAAGRFTITGVPAGDVQLRFTGSGIDAVVPVGTVQPAQTVSIVVTLSTVTITSICAVLAGYALVHLVLPGRTLVVSILVGSLFFPSRLISLIAIFEIPHFGELPQGSGDLECLNIG